MADIIFQDQSLNAGTDSTGIDVEEPRSQVPDSAEKFPPAILTDVDEKTIDEFIIWVDQWIMDLESNISDKRQSWADQEEAYRAKSGPAVNRPFVGASNDTVPAIAMAVDPIHARLDTGIFKQDPVFQIKPLKKSFVKYGNALTQWINYYQRNKLNLRSIASPRILEMTKLGTMILKTVYDKQSHKIKTYDVDDAGNWNVVTKIEERFSGPRVFGISLPDFMFPPLYQHLQDCPIVVERQRTTYWKLKVAEASKKLTNVDRIKDFTVNNRTVVETARNEAAEVNDSRRFYDEIEVYEIWCDYDINGDGLPEHLVATFHKDSRTLLQLRYNWYFHQRKPYTVVPYQITNDSLYGIGIAEMVKPFQDSLTRWQRMSTDNAYIANIRMFIVKKESGIEEIPRLYAGRCFFVDDPRSDFIPFSAGEIYPSTLSERQNLFGLSEKRTGVSDYLTGRESPIIGSRATATSTLALIQEGTKRVEEVLENIRLGFAEVIENCFYIWIQYGLGGLDDLVFSDDDTGTLVKEFFAQVKAENVNGSLAVDLSATDAAGNRQAMQTMQLQIIQVMMGYLEKLLAAGQSALMAQQQMPELALMIGDVMTAARKMFRDLLQKYDIRNPEEYLPDLEKYLNAGQQPPADAGQGDLAGLSGAVAGPGQLQIPPVSSAGPTIPRPAIPGSGNPTAPAIPFAGLNQGVQ